MVRWSTEVCFVFEKNQQQIANPKQRPQQQRAQTECFSWQQKGDVVFSNLFKKKRVFLQTENGQQKGKY